MTDSEFLALKPTEAYEYALEQEPKERVRLLKLYRKITGEGAYPPACGESNEPNSEYPSSGSADDASPQERTSIMRIVGRAGFIVLLLFIGLVIVAASVSHCCIGTACLSPVLSLLGLFAFMWMLGALEMRLIEINQTLNRKLGA